ncbi:LOB domain-containing protein 6-like [Dorcoceras hygrometricum]|uniref:LOB domain-containing protein 6-like n=1 Tax=Dorcoceras hygrometricum TaxID=472368 RepID=A0A2Z7AXW4_9LAMI|nr:LOB domain-containing protein 6-like [Dorcoceras hygrometricum]
MDEVVTSVNTSQSALGANLVRKFDENHQQFANEITSVRLQLAELVDCLKELSDAKKGESSKKRRLV